MRWDGNGEKKNVEIVYILSGNGMWDFPTGVIVHDLSNEPLRILLAPERWIDRK